MNLLKQPLKFALASALALGLGGPAFAQNPCAAKRNPCTPKSASPCAAKKKNPCAAKKKNPCAAKKANPCAAASPCAAKNPCAAKK